MVGHIVVHEAVSLSGAAIQNSLREERADTRYRLKFGEGSRVLEAAQVLTVEQSIQGRSGDSMQPADFRLAQARIVSSPAATPPTGSQHELKGAWRRPRARSPARGPSAESQA